MPKHLPRNSPLWIYPTESSYALGCRFDEAGSIQKIMQLKGRRDDRFTLIASSLRQVEQYFHLSVAQKQLAIRHWPAALSIVINQRFAIRVPDMDIPRRLAKKIGAPLVATSLNISGQPPIFDLRKLDQRFADIPRIDIGPLPQRPPSTIVECFRGGYVIHRQGAVKLI